MNRLTPITADSVSSEQHEVWERITSTRGGAESLTGPDGALMGPFNAMVASPTIGMQMAGLGAAVRGSNSLPENLLELAICTTGSQWKANFEWWAHRRLAVRAGVSEEVLDSIERGDTPVFADRAEAAVHTFASELLRTTRVSDDTWASAREHLSEQQTVDLVVTVGYYCLISSVLNSVRAELPQGHDPVWPY